MNVASTSETIDNLKRRWATPRKAVHDSEFSPFLLHCAFNAGASEHEIALLANVPNEMQEFWRVTSSAELFKDAKYGQWGLSILSPSDASKASTVFATERKREAYEGDLVVGTFFGDSELVIVRCDLSRNDFGRVLIALPLDVRDDWPLAAANFKEFLESFVVANGAKFWE